MFTGVVSGRSADITGGLLEQSWTNWEMILTGNWVDVLRTIESESVHCVVTSPPYWGLRDYGVAGQLGLESTPEEYVAKLVEGFREVRRVLRSDGTLWLNLGDCYANDGKWGGNTGGKHVEALHGNGGPGRSKRDTGLKPKDLVGIPWRVAFALQADGWYLRSDIIWAKPNPMPESVTDRPTKAHEYLFLLTKSERYYYDAEAIKEPACEFRPCGPNSRADNDRDPAHGSRKQDAIEKRTYTGFNARWDAKEASGAAPTTRNKRTVWEIATQPFPEAHFATFPEELVKPCILAGTSEKGCCAKCGAPWERVVEHTPATVKSPGSDYGFGAGRHDGGRSQLVGASNQTTGWQPTCSCGAEATKRSVVLDPFAGSGTVGLVARLNHCDFIGIELNPEYCRMAARRLGQEVFSF